MAGEWKDCLLGDVIELKRGYDLPQKERLPGTVPLISSSGVTDTHATAMVKGPGVVTGRYGTLGQVFYIEQDFWPLNTTLYVRNFKGNDPRFISYFLRNIDFLAYSDKAAVPGLNRNHLHKARVRIPADVVEQRAIAHILGTLDDKIELNRKQNETLEAMARALFKAWFVDFEPVRAKMEGRWQRGQSLPGLPAHLYDLFPDRLVESELGEIPEGWEIEELGAHLDVLESGRRPKGGVRGVDKGVPSVGAESITGVGQFEFGKTKYVSEEFFAAMKSGQVESMDVLLYKDGGKPGDFKPRVSMFGRGFPFERFAINEHVFRMRSRSLGQAFLYLQMSDERILFELRSRGGKAAIPGINQADVRTLLVIVPPRELLTTFDKAALPMMEGILDRAIEGRAIAQLRDTLLPKLISGDLRIAEVENFMGRIGV